MGLSWVSHSTLIYTAELILCSTIWEQETWQCRARVQCSNCLPAAPLNRQILHSHWNNSKIVKIPDMLTVWSLRLFNLLLWTGQFYQKLCVSVSLQLCTKVMHSWNEFPFNQAWQSDIFVSLFWLAAQWQQWGTCPPETRHKDVSSKDERDGEIWQYRRFAICIAMP